MISVGVTLGCDDFDEQGENDENIPGSPKARKKGQWDFDLLEDDNMILWNNPSNSVPLRFSINVSLSSHKEIQESMIQDHDLSL